MSDRWRVLDELRSENKLLEAELAGKDKRIAELEEDVRMNSHMVAKLNDETVPERTAPTWRAGL